MFSASPAGDLFALGSKDHKSGVASRKNTVPNASTVGALPVKRESPAISALSKKPRLHSQTFTPLGRGPSDVTRTASPTTHIYLYEEIARESMKIYNVM